MGNLDLWQRFEDIDPKFTKAITGRDYSGTSPNPQYVIRCLTEMFGPVGKGFGWQVVAEEFTPMGGDTILHWCRIRFWWRDSEGEHSVEEYGQTKAAYTTSKGTHRVDEDAPKKSLTDAIVKGASHIGVAANIFLGRWDDSRYVAEVNAEFRREEREASAPPFNAIEARDRIVKAFGEVRTLEDRQRVLAAEEAAMKRLKEEDPPKRLECDHAYKLATERIKAASQEQAA